MTVSRAYCAVAGDARCLPSPFGSMFVYIGSMPVTYASNSVVAFQPEPKRPDGRDLISLLVQTYPEFVASQKSVDTAARAAGVTADELRARAER